MEYRNILHSCEVSTSHVYLLSKVQLYINYDVFIIGRVSIAGGEILTYLKNRPQKISELSLLVSQLSHKHSIIYY